MDDLVSVNLIISQMPSLNETTECLYHYKYRDLALLYSREIIDYAFYSSRKYLFNNTISQNKRQDYKFKKEVMERDNFQCIISGNDMDLCDVAHIVPFSYADEYAKYDSDNGIVLSKELHGLFDKKMLKINPDTLQVEISADKLQNVKNTCNQYHGITINKQFSDETIEYLRKYYN